MCLGHRHLYRKLSRTRHSFQNIHIYLNSNTSSGIDRLQDRTSVFKYIYGFLRNTAGMYSLHF